MAILTGILMVGVLFAFVALVRRQTRGNIITFIVALGLLLIAAAVTGSQTTTSSTQNDTVLTAELEKQAQDLRSQLPKKMNETMTARGVGVEATKIMYDMELSSDIDESKLSNQSLKDPMVGPMCLNKDSRALLDAGAIFEYYFYRVATYDLLAKVAITKYDC